MERSELENKEICKKCGGRCCKAGGCMYFVTDFESMKLEYLESVLDTGRVSIKADLVFNMTPAGNLSVNPILYLKARNINHGEIDLISFQTRCASLEDNGCYFPYEERPSGGVYHIPNENLECYSTFRAYDEIRKYIPHQKALQRLVKRRTGMSVYEKLKEDVEELFVKIYSGDLEDANRNDLLDFKEALPFLKEFYFEQYCKALKRVKELKLARRQDDDTPLL